MASTSLYVSAIPTAVGERRPLSKAPPDGGKEEENNFDASGSTTTRIDEHDLDFIGSSHAVKDLFSLPYDLDRPISVALHNLGGTLLIDADHGSSVIEDESKAPVGACQGASGALEDARSTSPETSHAEVSSALVALSNLDLESDALTLVNSVIRASRLKTPEPRADGREELPLSVTEITESARSQLSQELPSPEEYVSSYLPPVPEPREYLTWKFRDMKLLVGSSALIYRTPETALAVRVEEANDMKSLLQRHEDLKQSGQFLSDYEIQHPYRRKATATLSYAEATRRELPTSETAAPAKTGTEKESHHPEGFSPPDLTQVRLQTCIVAANSTPVGGLLTGHFPRREQSSIAEKNDAPVESRSPVSTVLDIYLDNIMANVPQLALCLQEKGFVQSVKLLQTEDIPSGLLSARAVDTSTPFDVIHNSQADQVFSPKIMETNASTLLRFLKTNCARDNATYLLRRDAGQTNIQLYDITAISTQRQRQWVWWLAMMSYRFANRLRHVAASVVDDSVLGRNCRDRQRSLLQNTLDLLEVLTDMDGSKHESLVSAVCESLADTFLAIGNDDARQDSSSSSQSMQTPQPATLVALAKQPYGGVSVDALSKAQDHLKKAIKGLEPVLHEQVEASGGPQSSSISFGDVGSELEQERTAQCSPTLDPSLLQRVEPIVTQLFGVYHKFINVTLRLAEIHLRNYYSSSAMQALRLSARTIAATMLLVQLSGGEEATRVDDWLCRIQLQYTWLWEHCGHFARSFAADELWRDRGHASGDDIISVLQDAERAFLNVEGVDTRDPRLSSSFIHPENPLSTKSHELVNLQSLSGVVDFSAPIGKVRASASRALVDSSASSSIETARRVLDDQHLILREKRRVLVAAAVAYHRAIQSFRALRSLVEPTVEGALPDSTLMRLLQQRLGDACNETGKILLNEVRVFLTRNSKQGDDPNGVAEVLLSSAQFWFFESLEAFEDCNDLRNLALLRCNLCQSYKFRANHTFARPATPSSPSASNPAAAGQGPSHAELCLQEAANHLQAAHESLGERDTDPVTWDMVSEELAATFLVLGVRRRQSLLGSGNSQLLIMQALRLSPGKEHSIVDPMERARDIYRQLGNRHQEAACHYQLALYYTKVWPCQSNESKTREKLASAFRHYGSALSYFGSAVRGNEVTCALLCIDLSNLYSVVSGLDSTHQALKVCLDAESAFSTASIEAALASPSRDEWFRQMDTLATTLEDSVFKLLKLLVKLDEQESRKNLLSSASSPGTGAAPSPSPPTPNYKDLYRAGLRAKMTASSSSDSGGIRTGSDALDKIASHLLSVHAILSTLRDSFPKTPPKTSGSSNSTAQP